MIKDPKQRIGYNSKDYSEIKNHPFFNGIIFENLEFEDTSISEIKEKLLQFGYNLPKSKEEKQSSSIINKLYDDKKDFDDDDENPDNNENNSQRLSANNFDDFKNNLKGEAIEHNIINEEEKNEKEEDAVILEEKLQKKSPWLHYNTRIVNFFLKDILIILTQKLMN